MPETRILHSLADEISIEEKKKSRNDMKAIKQQMQEFFKTTKETSFKNLLEELELTGEEYEHAIRSSIAAPTVFLKRKSTEVAINAYNLEILQLTQSNMDIQFVINAHGCILYVVEYINKPGGGMSRMLREAAEEVTDGNYTLRDRLRKVANVFINGNVVSAQEAVYDILSHRILIQEMQQRRFIHQH